MYYMDLKYTDLYTNSILIVEYKPTRIIFWYITDRMVINCTENMNIHVTANYENKKNIEYL